MQIRSILFFIAWLSIAVFDLSGASPLYPFGEEVPNIAVQFSPTKPPIDKEFEITKDVSARVISVLEQDYEDNVNSTLRSRWLFRKSANFAEVIGNGFLYFGSGLSTIAAAVNLIGSQNVSNFLLFASAGCFSAHLVFIGFAKCFAREQREREKQLESLAKKVGFSVAHMECTITDDAVGAAAGEKKEQI